MSTYAKQSRARSLGRTGLIVAAMLSALALLGAIASSASAKTQRGVYMSGEASEEASKQPKLNAESYPTVIHGTGGTQTFQFKVGTWKCSEGQLLTTLASATAEHSFWQTYWPCTPPYGSPLIRANGCEYVLRVNNAGPPYTGQLDIVCPAGKNIEFEMVGESRKCVVSILPQTGLENVTYTNTGEGTKRAVDVAFNITGLKYNQSGGLLACGSKTTEFSDGTYSGTITLRGYDE